VGIVMKGRVMAAGRVDELVRHEHTQSVEIVCEGIKVDELPAIKAAATRVLQRGQQCLVALPGPDRQEEILAEIRAHGGRLVSVTPQKGSLEELFFAQESPRTGSQADHGA